MTYMGSKYFLLHISFLSYKCLSQITFLHIVKTSTRMCYDAVDIYACGHHVFAAAVRYSIYEVAMS
jgi:hypothetical protein